MRGRAALAARLQAEHLWLRDPSGLAESPWYARALSGGAAWLAACLLFPLVGLLWFDALRHAPEWQWVSGVLTCGVGVAVQRLRGEFARHAGAAVALAGLVAIAFSLDSYGATGWLVTALTATVLYWLGRGYVHRLLSAGVMTVALVVYLVELVEGHSSQTVAVAVLTLLAGVLWWCAQPLGRLRSGPAWAPMALACTLAASVMVWWIPGISLLALGGERALSAATWFWHGVLAGWPVLVTAVLAARAGGPDEPAARWLIPLLMLVLTPVWLAAPGLGLALAWLALGHAHGRPVLVGVGVAAMGTYLVRFYYLMDTTLLHKALWLGVAGVALLLAAWLLTYQRGRA